LIQYRSVTDTHTHTHRHTTTAYTALSKASRGKKQTVCYCKSQSFQIFHNIVQQQANQLVW